MNRAKIVLTSLTLTGIVVFAVLAIGAQNLLAAAQQAASQTAEDDPAAALLDVQGKTEENLADMQGQEADYAAQIERANSEVEQLNAQLTEFQVEGQNNQATIANYESQLAYANNRAYQLRGAIATMQGREGQWLEQINAANASIAEMEAYIVQYNAALMAGSGGSGDDGGSSGGGGGHDDDEHEDEHEDEGDDD
jgi:septal ring factor EnvC (AmiA/AmiB activator)